MAKERTLYDCFNARVKSKHIYCAKGHRLGPRWTNGTLGIERLGDPLVMSVCQSCLDFDSMDDPTPTNGIFPEGTLTGVDLARLLGIGRETIHRRRRAGKLSAIRYGRNVYYLPEEVEKAKALTTKHCLRCGKQIPFNMTYCSGCGKKNKQERNAAYYRKT